MELKIDEIQVPEKISFNFEELKADLLAKCSEYEMMVYTDDQIKTAKSDRATLNRLKKSLNDERIRREKEYLKPFEDFKSKINEIIAIIDKPVGIIDKQVKAYEEEQKVKKTEEIQKIFDAVVYKPEWLLLKAIWNERWLNATFTLGNVEDEIETRITQINKDVSTLANLPDFGFEATEVYKTTLDVNKALNEGARLAEIQKKKAEAEQAKKDAQEPKPEPPKENFMNPPIEDNKPEEDGKVWVNFSAYLDMVTATKLSEFCKENKIIIKRI